MKATIRAVYDYLRAREPKARDLSWEFGEAMLRWYARRGLLGAIVDDEGRVTAVGYGRRVADLAMAETDYAHAEDGPILWIDWIGADSPRHMASLLDGVSRRWPDSPPVEIRGEAARHGDAIKVIHLQKFAHKLRHL